LVESALIFVRVPKRIATKWVAKHRKDGLDEYKLIQFVETQYALGSFERVEVGLLRLTLTFRKRTRQPLQATLWVRERDIEGVRELILIRTHVRRL
jgi:hypothetical protein